MPKGNNASSLNEKLVWGLSLSHFFIFIVCIIAVISFSDDVDALGPIIAYSICGYVFSLFVLLASATHLALGNNYEPNFLERHISIACLGGLLSAIIYPTLLFYYLENSSSSVLFQPRLLISYLNFDVFNIASIFSKCAITSILFGLTIYISQRGNFKVSLNKFLLVFMVTVTAATNLSIILSITTAQSLVEFLSYSVENTVFLVLVYFICFFIITSPNISVSQSNFKKIFLFGCGSIILCMISIYSFASIMPSSALVLPLAIVIAIALFLRHVNNLENQIYLRTKEISEERDKTDKLLANILPRYVIDDLKIKGTSEPKEIEGIAIMFTDFVGFTEISKKITAKELISELNDIFTAFDNITENYSSERIKTIGDAYMCVSGLDSSVNHPQQNIINIGMEMLEYLKARNLTTPIQWHIRIGISSGMAVGGIVGSTKYLYDLFGDAVNTAARMESNSEPQKINVDDNTYNLSHELFKFTKREPKFVKGKGNMQMYFVDP
jgi:class 3 adenylate cyclase